MPCKGDNNFDAHSFILVCVIHSLWRARKRTSGKINEMRTSNLFTPRLPLCVYLGAVVGWIAWIADRNGIEVSFHFFADDIRRAAPSPIPRRHRTIPSQKARDRVCVVQSNCGCFMHPPFRCWLCRRCLQHKKIISIVRWNRLVLTVCVCFVRDSSSVL